MKFISAVFLLAVLLFMAPTNARALLIDPTVTVNGTAVTLTGTTASCGTGCTLFFIQTGAVGTTGLTIFNYSSTSLAAIKFVDGTNSDSLSLTNVILQNNTGATGTFDIVYLNTFSPIASSSQNYQLLLSGLFARPGSSTATGDSVSLSGQVSFDGGDADFHQITVGTVSQIGQTVGSNLVGAISPLKLGPVSITCPFTTPCTDTLIGDLFLNLGAGDTFKMSGSSALGECDPDFIALCTAQFNDEVQSWQTVQTPEPGSLLLVISGMGALGLGLFGKKRFFK
jgi:PEP-CTERM motif-containing protein